MSPSGRRVRLALLPAAGPAFGLFLLVAVLAAAVVSAPRFTDSAEQAAWENRRDTLASTSLGATFAGSTLSRTPSWPAERIALVPDLDAALTDEGRDLGLPDPVLLTLLANEATAAAAGGSAEAQLISREGAADHVRIVAGSASPDGVLVPDLLAERTGVGPGDRLALHSRFEPEPAVVPVSGVYVTPLDPLPDYWDGQGFLFRPTPDARGNLVHPPPAVLAPAELAQATASRIQEDQVLSWYFPPESGATVGQAQARAVAVEALRVRVPAPESPVAALLDEGDIDPLTVQTALPAVLDQVAQTVALLEPPVRAVGIGGGAAAVVLIGAWAALRVRRRDAELRLLAARGVPPLRTAGTVALEALLPVGAGLVVGGAVGVLLVDRVGPAADPPPLDLGTALLVLAASGAAALAVVATVTAVLAARLERLEGGLAGSLAGRVPWLAVAAAVTVATAVPLLTADPEATEGVSALALGVPLLATAVVAGAAVRVLAVVGRWADPALRRLPTGAFLAVRRVLAGPVAARLVVTTTALALGLVVYSGTLADSTSRTVAAKAAVATGGDVVVSLGPGNRLAGDGELPGGTMEVGDEETATLRPDGGPVDVLVVHPERVEGIVEWHDALAEQPLAGLMAALTGYAGERVPVLAAGPLPDGLLTASGGALTVDFRYFSVPVQVVGRADAFPGQSSSAPLLVADWDGWTGALVDEGRDPDLVLARQIWARGEAAAVLEGLGTAGYGPFETDDVRTARQFADRPELRAQTWALDYLAAVSLAAGVLGLVGTAMFALAQQRRRTVAAVLLRRMGMGRRATASTAGLELGLLTGLAAVVAIAVGLPASALVLRQLDPAPELPPGPLFAVPWTLLAVVLAGAVAVTVVGSVLVGRAGRRASGGQVMRDAD